MCALLWVCLLTNRFSRGRFIIFAMKRRLSFTPPPSPKRGRRGSFGSVFNPQRWAQAGNLGIAAATGLMSAAGRRYSRPTSSSGSSILTTQNDVSGRYFRRRMPRRRRRAWVKFVRKVNQVVSSAQALSSYTQTLSVNTSSAVDQMTTVGWGLYNVGGELAELPTMFTDTYGAASAPYTKLLCKSGCLDIEISNTGSTAAIIDIYTLVCRKAYQSAVGVSSTWNSTFAAQQTTGAKASNNPANSAFQNPEFLKYFKVLSKREMRLDVGACSTLQMRDPKNRYIQGARLATEPQYLRGVSKVYMIQFHGAPENSAGTARLSAAALTISVQKSYAYGIPPGQTKDNAHNA